MISAILKYRAFIIGSVRREFQAKYKSSILGWLWLFLSPLAMILIYTLIFSQIMRSKLPDISGQYAYSIYLCSGNLAWAFFAETLSRSQTMFIDNANLLKKMNFPRICLPAIVTLSCSLNFLIIFSLFTFFLIVSGNFPGLLFFAILPILAIQVAFSIGLGLSLGVLNVFFRDVGHIMGIILQFWFWLTPIIYPISIIPDWARKIILLNPMSNLILAYQTIIVHKKMPQLESLWIVTLLAIILCLTGYWLFKKHSHEMVDEL